MLKKVSMHRRAITNLFSYPAVMLGPKGEIMIGATDLGGIRVQAQRGEDSYEQTVPDDGVTVHSITHQTIVSVRTVMEALDKVWGCGAEIVDISLPGDGTNIWLECMAADNTRRHFCIASLTTERANEQATQLARELAFERAMTGWDSITA